MRHRRHGKDNCAKFEITPGSGFDENLNAWKKTCDTERMNIRTKGQSYPNTP